MVPHNPSSRQGRPSHPGTLAPVTGRPRIIAWYGAYCWLAAGVKVLIAGGGLWLVFSNEWWMRNAEESGTPIPDWLIPLMGIILVSMFLPMAVVTASLPRLARKKSTWQVHLTCLIMGCCTGILTPFALPLLIGWLRPEVKVWHDGQPGGPE